MCSIDYRMCSIDYEMCSMEARELVLRCWECVQGFDHFFNFLDVPVWTSDTSPSRVLIDGMSRVNDGMAHGPACWSVLLV